MTIEVVVANVDFEPFVPPHTVFYDTLRARCPALLDGVAAEDPRTSEFVAAQPPPLRAAIGAAVDAACGEGGPVGCLTRERAAEIERRHLEDRWAVFLCAHPGSAVEHADQSAAPVRD